MIPRISSVEVLEDYCLFVVFDDGKKVIYDVDLPSDTIYEYGVAV